MSARDISLDYSDDGKTLEAVKMAGAAEARLPGEGEKPGRQFVGGTLDLAFAPDGKMTSVVGRENVRVELPPVADAPPRTISAQVLEGAGQAGKGLTALTFATDVAFTVEALRSKSSPADNKGGKRTAHAAKLEISLTD